MKYRTVKVILSIAIAGVAFCGFEIFFTCQPHPKPVALTGTLPIANGGPGAAESTTPATDGSSFTSGPENGADCIQVGDSHIQCSGGQQLKNRIENSEDHDLWEENAAMIDEQEALAEKIAALQKQVRTLQAEVKALEPKQGYDLKEGSPTPYIIGDPISEYTDTCPVTDHKDGALMRCQQQEDGGGDFWFVIPCPLDMKQQPLPQLAPEGWSVIEK